MPEKGFPGGSVVKNLLQYGRNEFTRGLGRSLEKEMATHSSILAWEIPRTQESGGLQSMESQKSGTQQQQQWLKTQIFIFTSVTYRRIKLE